MMEAQLKVLGGKLVIKVSGDNAKDLFKEVAAAQEVFDASQCCGMCQSTNLRFNVRVVDSFTFYELRCSDCQGALSYGQRKDMVNLYPKEWSRYEHAEA